MIQDKEQWIEEVMNSLQGTGNTQAPGYLHRRIVGNLPGKRVTMPANITWGMAAGIALLVAVNIYSVLHFNAPGKQPDNMRRGAEMIANEYFNNNNINL